MKIALIAPINKEDYLTNTVIDGLMDLHTESADYICRISSSCNTYLPIKDWCLQDDAFIRFAGEADIIILCWGKNTTDYALAEKIGRWDKTVFVDGSEVGLNRRFDLQIRDAIIGGTYSGLGAIEMNMLKKCALYFRREKPYIDGIIPFPFGIEKRYIPSEVAKQRDIDFTCIFGQDEYPTLRREVRTYLEQFCRKNGFTFRTKSTNGSRIARMLHWVPRDGGRRSFYNILSRTKVGISVGGGGFDTARFWEILGNGCFLMTENIDIFEKDSKVLDYRRVVQFKDLVEFKVRLSEVAASLRDEYDQSAAQDDYRNILKAHSSKARALVILENARKKGIIKKL